MISNFQRSFNVRFILRRQFSSALYITGDKAHKTFALLTPVIDFEKQLVNKDILERNFKARGLPLDVNKIEERWQFFEYIDDQKKMLELTKSEIGRYIAELMKDEEKNKEEIEKYKLHSKFVKQDLKNVKDYFCSFEEDTMLYLLNLPNVLHEKTPLELSVVHQFLEKSEQQTLSHMEIAEKANLIQYVNSYSCFLKSDAALFEIATLNYFRHNLLDIGFTQFSNPDFCRSIIVEGCGVNFKDKANIFIVEEPQDSKDEINCLHLCGAASLYSFMAYFTRHTVQQSYFPLKLFSLGKIYRPIDKEAPKNLFNLGQESVINLFAATLEEGDILDDVIKHITTLYESLGYHFRLVYLPANELDKSESLKLSIQVYSNHLKDYVEVGNISAYDNYLSKRLLFNYSVNKERKYPRIIAGVVLNLPKLLGCVLENNSITNTNLITPLLKKYMFV